MLSSRINANHKGLYVMLLHVVSYYSRMLLLGTVFCLWICQRSQTPRQCHVTCFVTWTIWFFAVSQQKKKLYNPWWICCSSNYIIISYSLKPNNRKIGNHSFLTWLLAIKGTRVKPLKYSRWADDSLNQRPKVPFAVSLPRQLRKWRCNYN